MLSQTHAFSEIHAVFSDGLAECSQQLLHAVASPFPGPLALKYGVFYISLSIDSGGRPRREPMGCILEAEFEQSLMKLQTVHEF